MYHWGRFEKLSINSSAFSKPLEMFTFGSKIKQTKVVDVAIYMSVVALSPPKGLG